MKPKHYLINLMAEIIGLDDTFHGDRLNDVAVWDQFIGEVFKRMDEMPDERARLCLNALDRPDFQEWIDDPQFWLAIDEEIRRRGRILKTMIYAHPEGHC